MNDFEKYLHEETTKILGTDTKQMPLNHIIYLLINVINEKVNKEQLPWLHIGGKVPQAARLDIKAPDINDLREAYKKVSEMPVMTISAQLIKQQMLTINMDKIILTDEEAKGRRIITDEEASKVMKKVPADDREKKVIKPQNTKIEPTPEEITKAMSKAAKATGYTTQELADAAFKLSQAGWRISND